MLSTRQRELVQATWKEVLPIQDAAAAIFYDRLFKLDPTLRQLFPEDLREQRRKLMQSLHFTVSGLDSPERLLPALQDLGRMHRRYGVREEDFDTVGEALLWTLKQGLGTAFTPEVREAWATAYALVSDVMRDALAQSIA